MSAGNQPGWVYLQAPSGQVIGFTEPVHWTIQEQWDRGQLHQVNADGSEFGDEDTEPDGDSAGDGHDDGLDDDVDRPPATAPKAAWVKWAADTGRVHIETAESMTKAELQNL